MNNEQKLRAWLAQNAKKKTRLSKIKWERIIYGAYEMMSREVQEKLLFEPEKIRVPMVGRIDLIFTHEEKRYCCELKLLDYSSSNFWDALKILGYTVLYNWQNKTSYKPSVMIPKKKIKLEHHIVANKLKLTMFEVSKKKGDYIIEIAKADNYKRNF